MSISAMKQALEFCEDIGDLRGPYPFLNETTIVFDSRKISRALRQAIAEAEKQEQKTPLKVLGLTVFTENRLRNGRVYDVETLQAMTNKDILAIPDMGKKALKEVLEALDVYASDIPQEPVDETVKCGHDWGSVTDDALIEEVRRRGFTIRDAQIIAEAEKQEPVAFHVHKSAIEENDFKEHVNFYTGPAPSGDFVTLYTAPVHASDISEERVDETAKDKQKPVAWWVAAYIEAKLKEKNVS